MNLNFIDGKIHLKPFINSIVITLTPFLHISLGYYFLVKGWLIFTIFISLLPTFYLLKNNSIDLKDEFSFKYFDTQQIKALFNKMPLYFFNIKFLYITEIFVFFFLAKNIGLLQSGALAFFFRIILMFSKLVGEVFQKKFFWQNISEKNNISFKDSSIKRIIYLSLLISVAIFIMIPGLHLLIDYILPKYTIVIEFVSLAGIIIFSELICGDILRRLFIKQVNSTLLKILIVNISLHAIFFSYIYNTELTLNQIALCLSCLWLVKFIFVTSISLKPCLEYLFLLFLIFTISIYSLLFSFISDLYYFLSFENMYIFLLLILMFISCLSIFLYLTKKKFV